MFTLEKALLLVKTFEKAPQLFHFSASSADPDLRSWQKKHHQKSSSFFNTNQISSLYPNMNFQKLLKVHGEEWHLKPSSFLTHWDAKHNDLIVRLYITVEQIDNRSTNRLMKQTLCLALAKLHQKGTKIDDLVSQVYSSKKLETCYRDDIQKNFYCIFKAGAKWKCIIAICARTTTLNRHEKISDHTFSDIVWLLDQGSMWVDMEKIVHHSFTNAQLRKSKWRLLHKDHCRSQWANQLVCPEQKVQLYS